MLIKREWKDKIESIERESGLIDGCVYMVYFKGDHSVFGTSYPIKNAAELESIMEDY